MSSFGKIEPRDVSSVIGHLSEMSILDFQSRRRSAFSLPTQMSSSKRDQISAGRTGKVKFSLSLSLRVLPEIQRRENG